MQRIAPIIAIIMLSSLAGGCAITTDEVKYKVVLKTKDFELRDYPAHVVAETVVDGTLEDAGNKAFGRLFGYISGKNRSRDKIAMTAPVSQEPASEKIAMTAPVGQQRTEGGWVVSFTMPISYTLKALPVPEDADVKLHQVIAARLKNKDGANNANMGVKPGRAIPFMAVFDNLPSSLDEYSVEVASSTK